MIGMESSGARMQRILLLTNFRDIQLLKRHALAHQAIVARPLSSMFAGWTGSRFIVESVVETQGGKPEDFDAVFIQRWVDDPIFAHVIAKYLQAECIPFIGSALHHVSTASKLADMLHLVRGGLPYPKTFYASSPRNIPVLLNRYQQFARLWFPLIVKEVSAACGEKNHRVFDFAALNSLAGQIQGHYLVQEYIPNSYDFRILIIGGEVAAIIKRQRHSDATHLNNRSRGADIKMLTKEEVGPRVISIALAAALSLGRSDIAGVDIVIDSETNLPYVLEVNRSPMILQGAAEHIDIGQKLAALFRYLDTLGSRRQRECEDRLSMHSCT
jgi:glutathione synthase/RimK-type ligase-like ATP-grasp enzyme